MESGKKRNRATQVQKYQAGTAPCKEPWLRIWAITTPMSIGVSPISAPQTRTPSRRFASRVDAVKYFGNSVIKKRLMQMTAIADSVRLSSVLSQVGIQEEIRKSTFRPKSIITSSAANASDGAIRIHLAQGYRLSRRTGSGK